MKINNKYFVLKKEYKNKTDSIKKTLYLTKIKASSLKYYPH